jgi:hypothetical protein
MAYPNILSPELTAFTYMRGSDAENLGCTTPFAISVPLIKGPQSTIYCGEKYPVAAMLKNGWRILAWDWSSHGKRDDPKNYMIAYLGKAFDKPALAEWKPDTYDSYTLSTGCSDKSCKTFATLKTMKQQAGNLSYGGGGWLRLYYGPKLTPVEKAEAKLLGWRGVRGTNLLVLGKTTKELPADVKEDLGL